MTQVRNHNWFTFDGEPITGRVPPKVMVYGSALSEGQQHAVKHEYKLFANFVHTALGGFHSKDREWPDGTRIRMISNNGRDEIYVWPAEGRREPIDPSGYLTTPTDKDHPYGWDKDVDDNPISPDAHIAAADAFTIPPDITLHSKYQAGAVTWICPDGQVLSYDHGGNNRYATNRWDNVLTSSVLIPPPAWSGVYYRGSGIFTGFPVDAVAVFEEWLIAVSSFDTIHYCISPLASIDAALAAGQYRRTVSPTWTALTLTGVLPDANIERVSAWHFKPDGTRAACAVLYKSIYTTDPAYSAPWSMARAMREAVPQAKRYIDFTAEGIDLGRRPVAVMSDVEFATQPIGARVAGAVCLYPEEGFPSDEFPAPLRSETYWSDIGDPAYHLFGTDAESRSHGGVVTYTGRRLWGVDYGADGEELVITMVIYGGGSVTRGFDGEGTISSGGGAIDMAWDIRINEVPLITVPTQIDSFEFGPYLCHYVTLHDLDARYKAAVVERLVRFGPAADVMGTSTVTLEHTFDGELQFSDEVPFPEGDEITARILPSERLAWDWEILLNRGFYWINENANHTSTTTTKFTSPMLPFPQIQGRKTENAYDHHARQPLSFFFNAEDETWAPRHEFVNYPNQVGPALFAARTMATRNTLSGYKIVFGVVHTSTDQQVDVDFYPALTSIQLDRVEAGDHANASRYVQGFARRNYDVDHYVVATKATCARGFMNMIRTCESIVFGDSSAVTNTPPTVSCSAMIRPPIDPFDPDADRPFTRHDLMEPMKDKINAEQLVDVDEPSFRIDPIRVI